MTAGEIRYAEHDGANIAYRVWGEGPPLVYVPSQFVPITAMADDPAYERFLTRLGSFSSLITFDRLGIGFSDPMPSAPTVEDWAGQIESVVTAAGFESAFILATAFGGIAAVTLAATKPHRVRGLAFAMALAGTVLPPDMSVEKITASAVPGQRDAVDLLRLVAPSRADDPAFRRWWDEAGRRGASPAVAQALLRMQSQADATHLQRSITAPTVIVTRPGYTGAGAPGSGMDVDIAGARVVEVGGVDLLPWLPDSDAIVAEVEQLVTGEHVPTQASRVVLAVMFTDVVGSTDSAVKLGDRQWTDLLELHDRLLRGELARFDGTEIDTAGDGFLSTFATPSQAIRCASRLHSVMGEIGLRLRVGIHCGEVELREPGIAGVAVHIAARVQAKAAPGETLVTSATKDIVTGSGVVVTPKGRYALKGVPGRWVLYTVDS